MYELPEKRGFGKQRYFGLMGKKSLQSGKTVPVFKKRRILVMLYMLYGIASGDLGSKVVIN